MSVGFVSFTERQHLGVFQDMSFNLLIMNKFRSITAGIQAVAGKVEQLWQMITTPAEKTGV